MLKIYKEASTKIKIFATSLKIKSLLQGILISFVHIVTMITAEKALDLLQNVQE
jgi:hypothetical protein